jgi:hypothetical protein
MAVGGAGVVAVPVVHVDMLDEVQSGQEFHRPVHAGQANPVEDPTGAPMHLGHLQVLGRVGQDLEHRQPSPRDSQSSFLQRLRKGLWIHGNHLNENYSHLQYQGNTRDVN